MPRIDRSSHLADLAQALWRATTALERAAQLADELRMASFGADLLQLSLEVERCRRDLQFEHRPRLS